MRKAIMILALLVSGSALAVTGNGTGSSVEVTGGGTGVTGGGTGSGVQVTGNGTGSSVQVTGNGTGSSVQVTGGGTGSGVEVTGGGTGSPVSIDACMSGSFYDPENPGQGINVEVLENAVVVYFYDADGNWFIFQGDDNGLDMYQPYGEGVSKVGSGYFIAVDDSSVDFGFDMQLDLRDISAQRPIPWCLRSDCAQAFEYKRLTQPIPCAAGVQVTGNGTGSSTQVTGNGTGGSTQVTGGGTGSSTQVTGGGTGSS